MRTLMSFFLATDYIALRLCNLQTELSPLFLNRENLRELQKKTFFLGVCYTHKAFVLFTTVQSAYIFQNTKYKTKYKVNYHNKQVF